MKTIKKLIKTSNKIKNFFEKRKLFKGYINAGIYILINTIMKIKKRNFQLEKNFLKKIILMKFMPFCLMLVLLISEHLNPQLFQMIFSRTVSKK